MKKFYFKIKGREYDAEILEYDGNVARIDVNGTEYEVEIEGPQKTTKTPTLVRQRVDNKPEDSKIKQVSSGGASQVKAPLPGNIIKIEVSVGDSVAPGDTLMVMEAMKMENNIQAERGGTVKAIKVSVGDNVMQDDVLLELD